MEVIILDVCDCCSGKVYQEWSVWKLIRNICPLQEGQDSKRMSQQMSKSSSWLWILNSNIIKMEKVLSPPVHTWYICQAKNPRNWMVATSTKARSSYITLVLQPRCCTFGEPHLSHSVRTHLSHLSWEKIADRSIDTDRHTCTLYTHTKHCTVHTHIYYTRIQDYKLCHWTSILHWAYYFQPSLEQRDLGWTHSVGVTSSPA